MKTQPVENQKIYEIAVTGMGVSGEGIGKVQGFTVFIPGAIPGETVKARIQLIKKNYAKAVLEEILTPSSWRVRPACPVYGLCGGCQISHLSYGGQLAMKQQRVTDAVVRIGGGSGDCIRPILGAAHPWNYRNKMMIPTGGVKGHVQAGFYAAGSHRIVPTESCLLQKEENNRLMQSLLAWADRTGAVPYEETEKKGSLRHIMGRVGENNRVMAVLVTADRETGSHTDWTEAVRKDLPGLSSAWHNIQNRPTNVVLGPVMNRLWGSETIEEELCGLHFRISPYSFFQVNKEQAQVLYRTALSFCGLTGAETVIDAYCGTGTISLCMARQAKKVIGIEIVKPAVKDARMNAEMNHIDNAEFIAGDAGAVMPDLAQKGIRPDVIVCDPVRAGCSEEVLRAAAHMEPEKIVYVSCNPATMARDAARLRDLGYEIITVQPVDMFPQTMHVECVALMSRAGK